jgi:hypothetical protein
MQRVHDAVRTAVLIIVLLVGRVVRENVAMQTSMQSTVLQADTAIDLQDEQPRSHIDRRVSSHGPV